MPRFLLLLTALTPLVLSSPGALSAPIYRWVDNAGVVHYSESAPSGRPSQRIHPQTSPPTSAPAVAGVKQLSKQYGAEEARQDQAREAALKIKATQAEQCAKARQRISQLQTATAHRLFVEAPNGQRRRMTQIEFEKRLGQAQASANASCRN